MQTCQGYQKSLSEIELTNTSKRCLKWQNLLILLMFFVILCMDLALLVKSLAKSAISRDDSSVLLSQFVVMSTSWDLKTDLIKMAISYVALSH